MDVKKLTDVELMIAIFFDAKNFTNEDLEKLKKEYYFRKINQWLEERKDI